MHSAWTVFYNLTIASLIGAAAYIGEGENSVFALYEADHPAVPEAEAGLLVIAETTPGPRAPSYVEPLAPEGAVILAGFTPEPASVQPEAEPTRSPLEIEMAAVTGEAVNLRLGPSTSFDKVGSVVFGQELVLTGRSEGTWVEVEHPASGEPVWIASRFIN
jgi:hypothetical protein